MSKVTIKQIAKEPVEVMLGNYVYAYHINYGDNLHSYPLHTTKESIYKLIDALGIELIEDYD